MYHRQKFQGFLLTTMIIVSIDIGSTWTKGAVFKLHSDALILQKRINHPTTVRNLADGFYTVLNDLVFDANEKLKNGDIQLFYSSSAKGGLAVAALGIVPEVTLEVAKLAATSAGSKLTHIFSYHLTPEDIQTLEENPPDILLFTGGTDGGNSEYVLANAEVLKQSTLDCSIIYAGNRSVREKVAALLQHKKMVFVDNILPTIDEPNSDPARKAIRSIFLATIVKGKGLNQIIEDLDVEPLPTPYSVFEFSKAICFHVDGWHEFILLDLGGATTDIYSAHKENCGTDTVLRGIPEEEVKRTVEGDLGLRVSAESAADSTGGLLKEKLISKDDFSQFISDVTRQPDFLPDEQRGQEFDQLLAGSCISNACNRHAGRKHEIWTSDGKKYVQTGRDLSKVNKIIGSGGYLANVTDFDPHCWVAKNPIDDKGRQILLPSQFNYYRDEQYLLPLLANVAQGFPEQAARYAINNLIT